MPLPQAVFVKFDGDEGAGALTFAEGVRGVPIPAVTKEWTNKSGRTHWRRQVPLALAWAVTIHKSQGMTVDKARIDVGDREFSAGLSFVATSRLTSFEGGVWEAYGKHRFDKLCEKPQFRARQREEVRLRDLAGATYWRFRHLLDGEDEHQATLDEAYREYKPALGPTDGASGGDSD